MKDDMEGVTVLDVLIQAKENLKNYGWIKGRYVDGNGCMCLLGAVGFASGVAHDEPHQGYSELTQDLNHKAIMRLWKVLDGSFPAFDSIPAFNDDRNTRLSDVFNVLDKAIALEKEGA